MATKPKPKPKPKTGLAAAGVTAITAVALLGSDMPAFAKSSETLVGPHVVQLRQAFHLAVLVGDDGGAKVADSRLQVLATHRDYQWVGAWHQLRDSRTQDPNDEESYTFTVTENNPGTYTFRAVFSVHYPATSPITVTVR
jgi:hypothetical protein